MVVATQMGPGVPQSSKRMCAVNRCRAFELLALHAPNCWNKTPLLFLFSSGTRGVGAAGDKNSGRPH